jgi:ABC-type uncharacterized transport system substrate-binding protein
LSEPRWRGAQAIASLWPEFGYQLAGSCDSSRHAPITKAIMRAFWLGFAALLVSGLGVPALAHPHVWVTAREDVIFDGEGHVAAIRGSWVFDDMYSAFATQGLGKDGQLATKEELAPLAKTNVDSLAEFEYFTFAKIGDTKIEFGPPTDYSLIERPDKLVMLTFTLPLKQPTNPGKALTFQVYDPTYFVAFSLDDKLPVELISAPKGCSSSVLGADPLDADATKKLSEAFFANLSPGSNFGMKLASRIFVACP